MNVHDQITLLRQRELSCWAIRELEKARDNA